MKSENYTRSVLRVVAVLDSFTPDRPKLSAIDIARKTGIPKSTTHRILATLAEHRFLDRNNSTGKYSIGVVLFKKGSLFLKSTNLIRAAEPVVNTLHDLSSEFVSLCILDSDNVVFIMTRESNHHYRMAVKSGTIFPAYACAIGRAILSELPEAEVDRLYPSEKLPRINKQTIATKTQLKLELEKVRNDGISIDREGAFDKVEGIASVIRDANSNAVAAMSIAVPVFRMNKVKRDRLCSLIRKGASLISHRLGYHNAVNPVSDIQELHSW